MGTKYTTNYHSYFSKDNFFQYKFFLIFLFNCFSIFRWSNNFNYIYKHLSANEKFRIVKLSPENIRFTILIRLTLFILLKYKNIINYTRLNNTAVGILYESSNFTLLLCLIVYLLLTLVCVVELVKFESGPLIKRL